MHPLLRITLRASVLALLLSTAPCSLQAQWMPTGGPGGGIIYSLQASGSTLFAGTADSGLFRYSAVSGKWGHVGTGTMLTSVPALLFQGTVLFASTYLGVVRSTDGGTSWMPASAGLPNNAIRSLAASGARIFAGTMGGGVYRSTDSGATWTSASAGLPSTLIAALTSSDSSLFTSPGTKGVYRSTNDGESWTPVNNGIPLMTMKALTAAEGMLLAGGTGGAFLSKDNGASWRRVDSGWTNHDVTSFCVSGGLIFAGTWGGDVFLSTNGGTSWRDVGIGLPSGTVQSLAVSGTDLFAGVNFRGVGRRPLAEMTTPDWYPHRPSDFWNYSVAENPMSPAYRKFGERITVVDDTLMPNGLTYWKLSPDDPLWARYVRVDSAYVYYYDQFSGTDRPVLNLQATVGHTDSIWWRGGLLRSMTVTRIDTSDLFGQKTITRSYHADGLTQFNLTLAAGFGIVKAEDLTDTGGPYYRIWNLLGGYFGEISYGLLESAPSAAAAGDFHLFQNYPNPFNPSTTIRYSVTRRSHVTLSVFNLLGQEIAELVTGDVDAGSHEVRFDGSNLASGVYLYRLSVNGHTYSRRLCLIK